MRTIAWVGLALVFAPLVGCSGTSTPDAGASDSGTGSLTVADAGSCNPTPLQQQTCTEDRASFTFCSDSEAAQKQALCSVDAGFYELAESQCDGGVAIAIVHSGVGPTDTCVYASGALVGASSLNDYRAGRIYGRWDLGQVDTAACPRAALCR